MPTSVGSAVYLGDGLFLTNRHVLRDSKCAELDGLPVQLEVLRSGDASVDVRVDGSRAIEEDWALVRASDWPANLIPADYDPALPLQHGDEVYLLGYFPGRPEPATHAPLTLHLTAVKAVVVPAPNPLLAPKKHVLFIRCAFGTLMGTSGGAAVVVRQGRVIVVGIYRGTWEQTFLGNRQVVHTVLRIPHDEIGLACKPAQTAGR